MRKIMSTGTQTLKGKAVTKQTLLFSRDFRVDYFICGQTRLLSKRSTLFEKCESLRQKEALQCEKHA